MSSLGGQAYNLSHGVPSSTLLHNGIFGGLSRSRTPNPVPSQSSHVLPETEPSIEDDPRSILFKELFARTEPKIEAIFDEDRNGEEDRNDQSDKSHVQDAQLTEQTQIAPQPKKAARTLDEDDYDEPDEEEETTSNASPLKQKSTGSSTIPRVSSPSRVHGIPPSPALNNAQAPAKSSEDVGKSILERKKAAEDAAKKTFQTMFYSMDNDRDAMLEQQRLEESDRQVEAEMSGQGGHTSKEGGEGALSQANLGASSLVLKHLIARIDAKRAEVKASDQELRNLMIEVKKNRSKWASEDKIGQEELYEAAEKVLSEIKAMTEHSQPFLQRVNKREAPDYYTIIKHPMDLSTMTKKLKQVQYKSKKEFVDDLNLIWANCLKYNANPDHFLRKHALFMRKETEKIVPLIPDIVIRDRAEVEAEERRLHAAENGLDGAEDSDDEPIISSRGRKAPSKKAKKGGTTTSRKGLPEGKEQTPGSESKPLLNGIRQDLLRTDSDTAFEGSQTGFNTPPGTLTPAGAAGITASSQADPMDVDAFGASINGTGHIGAAVDFDDPEYKIWKQVTKKDRALVAAERHRLFKGDKLNPEEPALLRSKAGMRRWLRKQAEVDGSTVLGKRKREAADESQAPASSENLADGMDETEERVLPDYYDTMSGIPDLEDRLQWIEDSEGYVASTAEEALRVVPKGFFTQRESNLTRKLDSNMKQMQETRKVCTKIGIVKQMQLQAQMYQNQFQKYEPEPLVDRDIESHVVSDDGPIMSDKVCRAAMQRAVAKIFYAAGFEECQPSALDAMTDAANDYFVKLATTINQLVTQPKVPVRETIPGSHDTRTTWKSKFSYEECVLKGLNENGTDLEALENYVRDDTDRLTSKLGTLHERMKAHLAELLRPALAPEDGPDGEKAFNDGSEQFVSGDFATEDLDDDFFGFKELGLDKEFGLSSLSVPLHLLQNRMHSAYQSQNTSVTTQAASAFPAPPPLQPVTSQSIDNEIGLVQKFFKAKLQSNNDQPLVEDEDLPLKQRMPKPRLPPTGKITSPRKKPVREAGPGKGHPKKKMRFVDGHWIKESEYLEREKLEREKAAKQSKLKNVTKGSSKDYQRDSDAEGEEDDDAPAADKKDKEKVKVNRTVNEGGMISPESLEAM